jgi:hypothetical protein
MAEDTQTEVNHNIDKKIAHTLVELPELQKDYVRIVHITRPD